MKKEQAKLDHKKLQAGTYLFVYVGDGYCLDYILRTDGVYFTHSVYSRMWEDFKDYDKITDRLSSNLPRLDMTFLCGEYEILPIELED